MLTSSENVSAGPSALWRRRPAISTKPLDHPWALVNIGILILAIIIVRIDHTSPGYDPYGWLDWGYEGIRGTLSLAGAPSWKPVTFCFTLIYSIFGHYSYWLWVTTATAAGIGGLVIGGRVAYRIVRPYSEYVWPAVAAALFAGIGIGLITTDDTGSITPYAHYILSYQSDPMLVLFFLLGIDAFISRKYSWTHTWLLLVSLGRPEGWIVLGPYAVWCWFKHPDMRRLIVVELVLIPLLWFGLPVLCGQPWDVASKLALKSPRELHGNKIVGVIDRYKNLTYWPIFAGAAVALVFAAIKRSPQLMTVAAAVVAWMICEIGFALHGFPGVSRYMFEAGATTVVLGGIGFGLLVTWLLDSGPQLPLRLASGALAVVLVAFMVPYSHTYEILEHEDLIGQKGRTKSIAMLDATIKHIGGVDLVNDCGVPTVDVGAASILAWYTHRNVAEVGYIPKKQIRLGGPVVLFTGLYNGWVVHTYNLPASDAARCSKLNNTYWVDTPGHPYGQLVHQ